MVEATTAGAVTKEYVYGEGIDEVLKARLPDAADIDSDSNTSEKVDLYYHQNSLGSVVAVTDSAGDVVESYRYSPYGEVSVFDAAGSATAGNVTLVEQPFMFTGRRWDFEEGSGLYYYRLRYYDPVVARFVSRDPLGMWGDAAQLGNGQSYCGGDPVNFVDPFGSSKGPPIHVGRIDPPEPPPLPEPDLRTGRERARDRARKEIEDLEQELGKARAAGDQAKVETILRRISDLYDFLEPPIRPDVGPAELGLLGPVLGRALARGPLGSGGSGTGSGGAGAGAGAGGAGAGAGSTTAGGAGSAAAGTGANAGAAAAGGAAARGAATAGGEAAAGGAASTFTGGMQGTTYVAEIGEMGIMSGARATMRAAEAAARAAGAKTLELHTQSITNPKLLEFILRHYPGSQVIRDSCGNIVNVIIRVAL